GDTAYIKKDGITTAGIYTFILTATDHACSANTANIIFMVTVTKPVFSDSYAEGLESEWNMDECSWDGTAGEVADSSEGGSHSGTAKDGAFTTGSGKICRCASTDGGKASILLDPVLDIGADWTIATWFYWPLANTGSAYWTLTGGTNDHQILVNRASKLLGTYDTEVGTGWHSGGFNMAKLSKGWHHITAIGAGVKTKFYIDGVLKGTAGYKSETDIKTLGNNCTGGSQNWGKFDEMKVWSKVLTEDEIINLCSATRASCSGTCYSDPIAEYRMENHAWNGTAGEVLDSSSGDSNGVAVSGGSGVMPSQTTRSGGKVCEAGVFTRVDANNGGYLDLGDPGDGDLDPGNDLWTISTWIKWDGSSGDNIIFNKEKLYETRVKDGYVNYAWQPRWAWSGGKSLPVTANEWTYITTVYDGSRQILYKNGAEVYSRPQAGVMGSNGNKFLIGARVRGDAPPISFFGGMIDEVKIYNRALSENEIQADKNETRDCAADSAVINTTTVLNGSPSISPSAPITFSCDTADFYRDFTVSVPRPGALADWAITWLGTNPGGFEVVKTGDATVRFRKISTSTAGNGYQFKLTANNSSSTDNPIESGYYTLNISSGASGTRYHAGCVADWRLDESSGTIKDHSGQNNDGKTYGGVTYGAPGKVWTALKFDGTSGYVNCGNNTSLNILAGDFTVGAWIKPASHISKAGQRYTIMANYSPGWILDLSCDDNGTKEGYRFYSGKTVYKYTPPGGRFSLDWTHFIVTRNSKTKELKLYLNGELKRSWNKTTVGASTNSVLIGKRTDGSWFNGIIDEAQIYNRELSAAEITDLYNRDRP
ncbi:MAG: LamG domain-containing protein, partial [Thermodesulfobacteriota bacterium]|nr:LamG domain-containing protein [Thermodesulfobacteriota bacterium]